MTKSALTFVTFILFTVMIAATACHHAETKIETARVPAGDTETAEESATMGAGKYSSLAANQNAQILHILFSHARRSQILVSTFDVRLESATESKHMETLLKSKLYCNILKARDIFEHMEEQILEAAQGAYKTGDVAKSWFYNRLVDFAGEGPAQEAAMINILRTLSAKSLSLCGTRQCVVEDIKNLKGFSIDPLDDQAFAKFLKTNKSAIAKNAEPQENDLAPGDCFNDSERAPSQASPYDWKNRNWTGSSLPAGQFVFTYDDGPHPIYTREIRDTWALAGMAKPAFFWLSKNVIKLPQIVQELNKQGYSIGCHSERHADLGSLAKSNTAHDLNAVDRGIFGPELKSVSASQYPTWKANTLDREITQATETLTKALGRREPYFRLPYGSGTKNDLIGARFQALNVDHFFWRVDSLDWQDKNPINIRDRVITQMKAVKSGLILFHDIHPQSAATAHLMIQYLKETPTFKAVPLETLPGLKPQE